MVAVHTLRTTGSGSGNLYERGDDPGGWRRLKGTNKCPLMVEGHVELVVEGLRHVNLSVYAMCTVMQCPWKGL